MKTIQLTQKQVDLALLLAQERGAKAGGRIFGDRSADDAHFVGLLGEMAFGRHINQEPDLRFYMTHGDKGYDFIHKKRKIDVKTRDVGNGKYQNPDLIVDVHRALADIYVLAEVDIDQPQLVHLVGYAYDGDLKKKQRLTKHGTKYFVERGELWSIP